MNLKFTTIRKALNATTVVLLFFFSGSYHLSAQTINTWLGGTTDWNLGTNWSEGYPSFDHNLIIPENPVGGNFPTTVFDFPNDALVVGVVNQNSAAPPSVFISAADLTVNGGPVVIPMELSMTLESSLIGVTISSTGELTVEGELTVLNQSNFGMTNDGTLTNDGGIVRVDNVGNAFFFNEDAITNAATMSNINGGQILIGQGFDDGGAQTIDDDGIQNIGATAVFINDASTIVIDNVGVGGSTNQPIRNTDGASFTSQNNGQIMIGQSSTDLVANGLGNFGMGTIFINDNSTIEIDNVNLNGLANASNASFTNQNGGQIFIGQNAGTGDVRTGINNADAGTIFTNTGISTAITVDNTSEDGILNEDAAVFTNEMGADVLVGVTLGSIGPTGATNSAGFAGLKNSDATFNNNSEGLVSIGDSDYGIWNVMNANFNNDNAILDIFNTRRHIRNDDGTDFMNTNEASILLGQDGGVGHTASNGIANAGSGTIFTNSNSTITIDYTLFDGITNFNEAVFTNTMSAEIIIGENDGNLAGDGIQVSNDGVFNNEADIRINNVGRNGVRVESGGVFNNMTDGSLLIGQLGGTDNIGEDGILNLSTFSNDGGTINIDNTTSRGIFNQISSVFNNLNSAQLNIGQLGTIGEYGVFNKNANFTNDASIIKIDGVTGSGYDAIINFENSLFENKNESEILIAHNNLVPSSGIVNDLSMFNNTNSTIDIKNSSSAAIENTGSFSNTQGAFIRLGQNGGLVEFIGINNLSGNFLNSFSTIEMDNIGTGGGSNVQTGIGNFNGDFTNETGLIQIGQNEGNIRVNGIHNWNSANFINDEGVINIGVIDNSIWAAIHNETGIFDNQNCGIIRLNDKLNNTSDFINNGLFTINTAEASTVGNFINNGIIEDIQGTFNGALVTNNEIMLEPVFSDRCGELSMAFEIGGLSAFNVLGIFTDAAATTSAGTYDEATNSFVPNGSLDGANTLYVQIEDPNGGCTQIVSFVVNAFSFFIDEISINFDECPIENNGAIIVTAVSTSDPVEYSLDGVEFQASNEFLNLDGGDYTVTVRYVTSPFCTTSEEVTVEQIADTEDPDAVCATGIVLELDDEGLTSIPATDLDGGSTDNCGIMSYGVAGGADLNLDCSNFGDVEFTLIVTDNSGNTGDCTGIITVINPTPTVILCRPPVHAPTDDGVCGASNVPGILPPVVIANNCEITDVYSDAPLFFEVETIIVTWTIEDASGNATTCEQMVTIEDVDGPTLTCQNTINGVVGNNCTFSTSALLTPIVTDNCSAVVSVTNDAPVALPVGIHTVVWTAADALGNESTCEQTVNVSDSMSPVITSCPDDIEVEATTAAGAPVIWNVTANDNCTSELLWLNSHSSGAIYPLGETEVSVAVYDESGNNADCEFIITVNPMMLNVAQVSGLVTNEVDMPIEGAQISLSGAMTNIFMTDELGSFYFGDVPMADDITILPFSDENPMNGVSTYDLILINKHILGIEALDSPYKMIAADVNNTGSVSTLDIVHLRKMILYINDNFNNNTSWRFVPQAYYFPNPSNPFATEFPEFLNINNVDADIADADFIAIKTGDINGNAVPSTNLLGVDDRTEPEPFVFKVDNQKVEKGASIAVDFIVNETAVEGYQFTLNFDEKLNFEELISGVATEHNFGFTFLSNNAITVSWNGEMTKENRAFSLVFTANERVELSEALTINSSLTRAEAYTFDNGIANVVLDFQDGKPSTTNFALYQNVPNPFNGTTAIGFDIPNAGNANFILTDVAGKVIREWNNYYTNGYHQIQLNAVDFPSAGVYFYTLKTENNVATKRLILGE